MCHKVNTVIALDNSTKWSVVGKALMFWKLLIGRSGIVKFIFLSEGWCACGILATDSVGNGGLVELIGCCKISRQVFQI